MFLLQHDSIWVIVFGNTLKRIFKKCIPFFRIEIFQSIIVINADNHLSQS